MAVINRRRFLKLAGSAAALATVTSVMNTSRVFADMPDPEPPPEPLGRVVVQGLPIRTSPTTSANVVRILNEDDIIPLHEQVEGQAVRVHNNVWYRTDGGYVYSASVQPINDIKNTPEPERAAERFWGEVTVPYTDAYQAPDRASDRVKRLYYTGVFRVIDAVVA